MYVDLLQDLDWDIKQRQQGISSNSRCCQHLPQLYSPGFGTAFQRAQSPAAPGPQKWWRPVGSSRSAPAPGSRANLLRNSLSHPLTGNYIAVKSVRLNFGILTQLSWRYLVVVDQQMQQGVLVRGDRPHSEVHHNHRPPQGPRHHREPTRPDRAEEIARGDGTVEEHEDGGDEDVGGGGQLVGVGVFFAGLLSPGPAVDEVGCSDCFEGQVQVMCIADVTTSEKRQSLTTICSLPVNIQRTMIQQHLEVPMINRALCLKRPLGSIITQLPLLEGMAKNNEKQTYHRIIDIVSKNNQYAPPHAYHEPHPSSAFPLNYPILSDPEEYRKIYRSYPEPPRNLSGYYPQHLPPNNPRLPSQKPEHSHQNPQHTASFRSSREGYEGPPTTMYPIGMEPSNPPYPYSYPYCPYPGFSYPYGGMYPPYYYNRMPNELYSNPDAMGQGYPSYIQSNNKASYWHSQTSRPAPVSQQTKSFAVKQEIVISSDEEQRNQEPSKKSEECRQKPSIQERGESPRRASRNSEADASKPEFPEQKKAKSTKAMAKKAEDENPFYIKHKKIHKESKIRVGKTSAKDRPSQTDHNQLIDKKASQDKEPKEKIEKLIKDPAEAPQLPAVATSNKNTMQAGQTQEKDSNKKERVRDDHPLRELRYSESHGKIRIGNYFQSVIPDLLDKASIAVKRRQLQLRLQERSISALTF